VAVGSLAQVVAVDPHFAIAIHAIKVDEDQFAFFFFRQREGFSIPADTTWQRTTTGCSRVLLIEFTLDAPVMRYGEFTPAGVIKSCTLCQRNITQMKAPALIEGHDLSFAL